MDDDVAIEPRKRKDEEQAKRMIVMVTITNISKNFRERRKKGNGERHKIRAKGDVFTLL